MLIPDKNDLQTAIQARMGRHRLCRGRQAPEFAPRELKARRADTAMPAIGICVGPPGLFAWFRIIPVAHATGIGCVGLPALSRILTLIFTRRCVVIFHQSSVISSS